MFAPLLFRDIKYRLAIWAVRIYVPGNHNFLSISNYIISYETTLLLVWLCGCRCHSTAPIAHAHTHTHILPIPMLNHNLQCYVTPHIFPFCIKINIIIYVFVCLAILNGCHPHPSASIRITGYFMIDFMKSHRRLYHTQPHIDTQTRQRTHTQPKIWICLEKSPRHYPFRSSLSLQNFLFVKVNWLLFANVNDYPCV